MANHACMKFWMRLTAGALLLAVLSFIPLASWPQSRTAFAQTPLGPERPFGGMNVFNLICACSANVLVYVIDYAGKQLLPLVYQPGVSRLYLNLNIFGRFFVGSYNIGSQCLIFIVKGCAVIPSRGMFGF